MEIKAAIRTLTITAALPMVAAFALVACSSTQPAPEADWVEPGWMSQVRQENEAFESAMMACLAEHGVKGSITIGGGHVGVVTNVDETGQIPAGVSELNGSALEICSGEVPEPDYWHQLIDDSAYQQILDTRDCLVAQGLAIPDPPSKDRWIEDAESGRIWGAYDSLLGEDSPVSLAQLAELVATCPTGAYGGFSAVPDENAG